MEKIERQKTDGGGAPADPGETARQRRADEALRESEARLRMIAEQIPGFLWTIDTDLRLTSALGSGLTVARIDPADYIGRTLYEIFATHDPVHPPIAAHLASLAGEKSTYEHSLQGRLYEVHVDPLTDGAGRVGGAIGLAFDITERQRAETALRQSQEKYATLVETLEGIVWEADGQNLRFSFVSRWAERLLGYPLERWMNEPDFWMNHIHPEDRERTVETCRRATEDLKNHVLEYRFIAADGRVVWLRDIISVLAEDGRASRLIGVMVDVTERKLAEAERDRMLESERAARREAQHVHGLHVEWLAREQAARREAEMARREWQTTFDAMTDNVLLISADDRLIRANRTFYERIGKTARECEGRSIRDLLHSQGDYTPHEDCPLCQMRRRGERVAMELPRAGIFEHPIFVSLDPIKDDAGRTVAVVQVVRDLTDLYRARQEAERERLSLNAAIEQMAEAFFVCDMEGTILRANRHAKDLVGVEVEGMRMAAWAAILEGRLADEEGNPLAVGDLPVSVTLREARVAERRLWVMHADGGQRLLHANASPLSDEQGRQVGALALVRDITERQREQERSQQADKLRALGQLSAGVAHNFNNALAAVLGYTQLALPHITDPGVEKYLRIVEQSARDAANMVERIQRFSRHAPRRESLLPVRLLDVVRDAIAITRPRWRNDADSLGLNYEINFEWRAPEGAEVNCDPSELREVFVNIILNALDAMPIGGRLDIAGEAQGPEIAVRFTDTGSGMTEEIKRRIFEPFFTTKGVRGLGMGLSESFRIIERHGGRIDVDSHLRRGTTFRITLPVHRGPAARPAAAEARARPRRARILVIDDEDLVRRLLAAMLIEEGHEALPAGGAEEAFELMAVRPFDVVFTDLAMPKTDGIAAAAEIRARWPRTRIILMSGYGAEAAEARAGEARLIDAAISKPFDFGEIRRTLADLLADGGDVAG